jgi:hypothetical protein
VFILLSRLKEFNETRSKIKNPNNLKTTEKGGLVSSLKVSFLIRELFGELMCLFVF